MQNLKLSQLEKTVLNQYQHHFPLCSQPYLQMAQQLGVSETCLMDTLKKLKAMGAISRIGAVFKPNTIGCSTLAAIKVAPQKLQRIAQQINCIEEINHNYEREHEFNLWFVITASDQQRIDQVLDEIEQISGNRPMSLPMIKDYHIDLGFEMQW